MNFRVRFEGDGTATTHGAGEDFTPVELYARPSQTDALTAGRSILREVRRANLKPRWRAWDFLSIALAAAIADAATLRESSPDGWTREIHLDLALIEPDIWRPYLPLLTDALRFLTTDVWKIEITERASMPFKEPNGPAAPNADCVALLSGGLDSLIGGIDLCVDGKRPFLVSHTVRGDADHQRSFARHLGALPHIQLNHSDKVPNPSEISQRVRSLIFIAYGVLIASTVVTPSDEPVDLYVNENGFISINPALTPMRVGGLSTRTAHPRFLGLLQELLDATGLNVRLVNPYRLSTKGQMMVGCKNQDLLATVASLTTSCGRFQRYGYMHCGRCLPCQVRRAAFLRWGRADNTTYKYDDLGRNDEDHAAFDDVRAVAIARLTVDQTGLGRWVGNALSGVPYLERDAAIAMLRDGLDELGGLHDQYDVT